MRKEEKRKKKAEFAWNCRCLKFCQESERAAFRLSEDIFVQPQTNVCKISWYHRIFPI